MCGHHFNSLAGNRPTGELVENFLSELETLGGAVDSVKGNRLLALWVGQLPALAALATRFDVPCGADIPPAGEFVVCRVTMGEIFASSVLGFAVRVIVLFVPPGVISGWGRRWWWWF